MPALGPAAWWFGELLAHENLHWPRWLSGKPFPPRLRNKIAAIVVGIACVALLAYGLIAVPRLRKHEKVRQHARQIDAIIPPERSALRRQSQVPALFVLCPTRPFATSARSSNYRPIRNFSWCRREDETEAQTTRALVARPGPSWSCASSIIASARRLFFLSHPRADRWLTRAAKGLAENAEIVSLLTILRNS